MKGKTIERLGWALCTPPLIYFFGDKFIFLTIMILLLENNIVHTPICNDWIPLFKSYENWSKNETNSNWNTYNK